MTGTPALPPIGSTVKIIVPADNIAELGRRYGIEDGALAEVVAYSGDGTIGGVGGILVQFSAKTDGAVRLMEGEYVLTTEPVRMPVRDRTLDTAKSLVSGQRAADYGDARESFERIAAIWTAILGAPVTAGQAALMLAGLKMARLAQTIDHEDSWVDLAGYAALGAEVSS